MLSWRFQSPPGKALFIDNWASTLQDRFIELLALIKPIDSHFPFSLVLCGRYLLLQDLPPFFFLICPMPITLFIKCPLLMDLLVFISWLYPSKRFSLSNINLNLSFYFCLIHRNVQSLHLLITLFWIRWAKIERWTAKWLKCKFNECPTCHNVLELF